MECLNDFVLLKKPEICPEKLSYIQRKNNIYINLYEILIKKPLIIYQYPFKVFPKIEDSDIRIKKKLFQKGNETLKIIYNNHFISGNCLYAMNKINESQSIKCTLYLNERIEYTLELNKCENQRIIRQEDIHKDPLTKQIIEMIIRDILNANPKLELYKGIFVISDEKTMIETDKVSIQFYPGYTTSFVETDSGNYLNVSLKNKIIQMETLLEYLNNYKHQNNEKLQEEIKHKLIGKSFKVSYTKRNYIIEDILFDRNPKNQIINYEGKTINLIEYYKIAHNLKIRDQNQPLILVRRVDSQGNAVNLYFIPELCFLAGLSDHDIKDGTFMRMLAQKTKLEPSYRVNKANYFIKLFSDNTKDKDYPKRMSSKEKSDFYGIEVKPINSLFKAYYLSYSKLIGGNGKRIFSFDRTFPVFKMSDMTNWLCFYEKINYNDAKNLYNTLSKVSKAFGIKISEPKWVEIPNNSPAQNWIDLADKYLGKGKNKYNFVIFLLGKNEYLYKDLKIHCLYKNNYVSQVVKIKKLQNRGIMSICSKILLQINNKLGGISYRLSIDKNIKDKKLMIIGIDYSHIKNKRTGIAMVATINDTFDDFFNKEEIIKEKNKEQLFFCISSFIEEAIQVYKNENKEIPKGIIIYRQGVSLQQKQYLESEIKQIDLACKSKNILFYYILVNKKENLKFYEKIKDKEYSNPNSGLLILDGITNRNFFEFYIQPQEVNQGSAIPICYHVAYGNLDIPEIIPKLTSDLCHIYCNWEGKVRVPNVLKMAEKLSKMTVKYMPDELNRYYNLGKSYI